MADFGLARSSILTPFDDVFEGDSRFVDLLLLNNPSDLPKADIFSFGATLYSIILGTMLPENGIEWQRIRRGQIENLNGRIPEFIKVLIKRMMSPELSARPSASEILNYMNRANDFRIAPVKEKKKMRMRDSSA